MFQTVQLQRPFQPDGGHAFIARIPAEVQRAVAGGSVAMVTENGRVLGPAESLHQHIRDRGGGAFSIHGSDAYLSSSDGSDCRSNGRIYSLLVVEVDAPALRESMSRRDDLLLDLLRRSRARNNGLAANFFRYFQVVVDHLRRGGVPMPRRVLEIGSGRVPFTALRFLAAGVEFVVVNDVQRIDRTMAASMAEDLIAALDLFDTESADRLQARIERTPAASDRVGWRGLEVHDAQPFEELSGPADLDLVFSTSVLEHVRRPEAVIARMYELLRPGGHAWHCIDLRDHRDFGKPLDFLRLSEAEYAPIATENRLRAAEWRALLEAQGFEVIAAQYSSLLPGCARPGNDSLVHTNSPPVGPWVDAAFQRSLHGPFAAMDPVELSILGITFLCRKP